MYVRVRIDLDTVPKVGTGNREAFWNAFFSTLNIPLMDEVAAENKVRENFGDKIKHHILIATSGQQERRASTDTRVTPRISRSRKRTLAQLRGLEIDVLGISYGSIELLLRILGLDDAATADLVWYSLAMYSPVALADIFGASNQASKLTANVIDVPSFSNENVTDTRWKIASTSLLVPVILALLVCYVTFNAMNERMKNTNKESTNLMKALMTQNQKLSDAVMSRVSQAKAWEEFQQLAMKQILSLVPAPTSTQQQNITPNESKTRP